MLCYELLIRFYNTTPLCLIALKDLENCQEKHAPGSMVFLMPVLVFTHSRFVDLKASSEEKQKIIDQLKEMVGDTYISEGDVMGDSYNVGGNASGNDFGRKTTKAGRDANVQGGGNSGKSSWVSGFFKWAGKQLAKLFGQGG